MRRSWWNFSNLSTFFSNVILMYFPLVKFNLLRLAYALTDYSIAVNYLFDADWHFWSSGHLIFYFWSIRLVFPSFSSFYLIGCLAGTNSRKFSPRSMYFCLDSMYELYAVTCSQVCALLSADVYLISKTKDLEDERWKSAQINMADTVIDELEKCSWQIFSGRHERVEILLL